MRPLLRIVFATCSAFAVVGLLTLISPAGVQAADITVTTTLDSLDVDGECSLREAVIAANTNAAVDGCVAGELESDQIRLTPGETYRLSIPGRDEDAAMTGDLDITQGVNIWGGVIDAGGVDRAFDVFTGAGFGLRTEVFNGDAGAGDGGAVRMQNDCGAGQRRMSTGGLIRDNVAANGGAIAAIGCVTTDVEHATFMNNAATGDGGALWLDQGALSNVVTATFTGNTAAGSGGAVWATSDAFGYQLAAVTVADNEATDAGGIGMEAGSGAIDLIDVLLARNAGGNCDIAVPVDGQNNLSDDDSCGDLGTDSITGVDAMLEPLDDTWGPPSYGIASGSPAIDAGLAISFETSEMFDQRSTLRPQDGDGDGVAIFDIGAVEAVSLEPEEPGTGGVPSPSPELPNTALDGGSGSERSPFGLLTVLAVLASMPAATARIGLARLSSR